MPCLLVLPAYHTFNVLRETSDPQSHDLFKRSYQAVGAGQAPIQAPATVASVVAPTVASHAVSGLVAITPDYRCPPFKTGSKGGR